MPRVRAWLPCFYCRLSKTNPDPVAQSRAMDAARRSVLAVIVFRPSGEVMSGSGFVIRRTEHQGSIVLTSSHTLGLVSGQDVLRVRYPTFPTGVVELPATILYQDAALDVAILRVAGATLPALHFAPEDATVGESVVAVGYCDPDGLLDGLTFTRLPGLSPGLVRYMKMTPSLIDAVFSF